MRDLASRPVDAASAEGEILRAWLRPTVDGAEPVMLGLVVDSDAFGGAEVYVRQLLRRLPARFCCRLVVAEPMAGHFRWLAGRCTRVDVVPLMRGRDDSLELGRILAAGPVDVWHVNLVDPASNRAALAAAGACAPTVATLHMPGTAGDVTAELSALYRGLSAVIAVSAEIVRVLRDWLGVEPDRVIRVRGGVDIPPYARPPAPAAVRRPVRIGAVGRLTEQKGFDVLVTAVGLLVERGADVSVEIVGEGRDRPALEAAAAGLPIRFSGFSDDVPAFLRGLDVFCLPSRREALPFALSEAMGHALPCVTTAVGDVREVVGNAVRVVPPGDPRALAQALDDLIRNPDAAARLGRRARVVAERQLDAAGMVAVAAKVFAAVAGRAV
jgi:glycosyltransferase involved in cell wall biosynthesis